MKGKFHTCACVWKYVYPVHKIITVGPGKIINGTGVSFFLQDYVDHTRHPIWILNC